MESRDFGIDDSEPVVDWWPDIKARNHCWLCGGCMITGSGAGNGGHGRGTIVVVAHPYMGSVARRTSGQNSFVLLHLPLSDFMRTSVHLSVVDHLRHRNALGSLFRNCLPHLTLVQPPCEKQRDEDRGADELQGISR